MYTIKMAKVEALLLFEVVISLFVCNCLGELSYQQKWQIILDEADDVAMNVSLEIIANNSNMLDKKVFANTVDKITHAILIANGSDLETTKQSIFNNQELSSKRDDLILWTNQTMNDIQTDLEDLVGNNLDTFQSKCHSYETALTSKLASTEDEITTMITNSLSDFSTNVKQQTKREHIAFTALLSVNVNYSDFVCFDHVVVNHGNGYNKSSGLFTAPKDGVYLIISSFLVNDGYVNVELSVNGVIKGRGYASTETYETSGFVSSILKLVQGDKVGIKITEGYQSGYIRGDFYSSFTGTMIK